MADGTNPYGGADEPQVQEPHPTPKRRISRMVVIGGLAGAVALGGAGIAVAETGHGGSGQAAALSASSASTSTTTPTGPNGKTPPPGGHFRMGRIGAFGGFGGIGAGGPVVHGQYTVKSGSTYKTVDVQTGAVTSVSSNKISVKSSDGFTASYAVVASTRVDAQAGGISSVKVNDQVEVVATAESGSSTAVSIDDLTLLKNTKTHFGFGPGGPGGKGPGGPRTGSASYGGPAGPASPVA